MNERVEKLKQLVKIEEYAEYLGFHVIRTGRYYTLEEHDSVRTVSYTHLTLPTTPYV